MPMPKGSWLCLAMRIIWYSNEYRRTPSKRSGRVHPDGAGQSLTAAPHTTWSRPLDFGLTAGGRCVRRAAGKPGAIEFYEVMHKVKIDDEECARISKLFFSPSAFLDDLLVVRRGAHPAHRHGRAGLFGGWVT
jgi:hypothetical protein